MQQLWHHVIPIWSLHGSLSLPYHRIKVALQLCWATYVFVLHRVYVIQLQMLGRLQLSSLWVFGQRPTFLERLSIAVSIFSSCAYASCSQALVTYSDPRAGRVTFWAS